jgi:hypothetical protein
LVFEFGARGTQTGNSVADVLDFLPGLVNHIGCHVGHLADNVGRHLFGLVGHTGRRLVYRLHTFVGRILHGVPGGFGGGLRLILDFLGLGFSLMRNDNRGNRRQQHQQNDHLF